MYGVKSDLDTSTSSIPLRPIGSPVGSDQKQVEHFPVNIDDDICMSDCFTHSILGSDHELTSDDDNFKGHALSRVSSISSYRQPSPLVEKLLGGSSRSTRFLKFIRTALIMFGLILLLNGLCVGIGGWLLLRRLLAHTRIPLWRGAAEGSGLRIGLVEISAIETMAVQVRVQARMPRMSWLECLVSLIVEPDGSIDIYLPHLNDARESLLSIRIPRIVIGRQSEQQLDLDPISIVVNEKVPIGKLIDFGESMWREHQAGSDVLDKQRIQCRVNLTVSTYSFWIPIFVPLRFDRTLTVGEVRRELQSQSAAASDPSDSWKTMLEKGRQEVALKHVHFLQTKNHGEMAVKTSIVYPRWLVPTFLRLHIPSVTLYSTIIGDGPLRQTDQPESFAVIMTEAHTVSSDESTKDPSVTVKLGADCTKGLVHLLECFRDGKFANLHFGIRGTGDPKNTLTVNDNSISKLQRWLHGLEYSIAFEAIQQIIPLENIMPGKGETFDMKMRKMDSVGKKHRQIPLYRKAKMPILNGFMGSEINSNSKESSAEHVDIDEEPSKTNTLTQPPAVSIGLIDLDDTDPTLPKIVIKLSFLVEYFTDLIPMQLLAKIRGQLPPVQIQAVLERGKFSTRAKHRHHQENNQIIHEPLISVEVVHQPWTNNQSAEDVQQTSHYPSTIDLLVYLTLHDTSLLVKVAHKMLQVDRIDTRAISPGLRDMRAVIITSPTEKTASGEAGAGSLLAKLLPVFALEWRLSERGGGLRLKHGAPDGLGAKLVDSLLQGNQKSDNSAASYGDGQEAAKAKWWTKIFAKNHEKSAEKVKHRINLDLHSTSSLFSASTTVQFNTKSVLEDWPSLLIYWESADLSLFPGLATHPSRRERTDKVFPSSSSISEGSSIGTSRYLDSSIGNLTSRQLDFSSHAAQEDSYTRLARISLKKGQFKVSMAFLNPALLVHEGSLRFRLLLSSTDDFQVGEEPALIHAWKSMLNQWYSNPNFTPIRIAGSIGSTRRFSLDSCIPPRSALITKVPSEGDWTRWLRYVIQTKVTLAGLKDATVHMLLDLPTLRECGINDRVVSGGMLDNVHVAFRVNLPPVSLHLCTGDPKEEQIGKPED